MGDSVRAGSRAAVAGAALVIAVVGGVIWWWTRPSTPPNILLVTIDTLRADRVGAYGAREVATPALDRIAREGVRFDAAYAAVPLTLPSHTTMLSGLLPAAHTVRTNDGFRVPSGVPLVAEALRDRGYDTAAVVGAFVLRRSTGLSRGFVTYDDEMGPGGERRADEVAERAQDWLERPRTTPWFLWVHFFDPHLDYEPPEPYRSRYAGRPYDGEVAAADAGVHSIVEWLAAHSQWETTAVIVAADHGEALGDHGEASHGALLYDSVVRVPLIVRLPQGRGAGRVIADPVGLGEVAATIRHLAGLPDAVDEGLLAEDRAPLAPIAETLYLKMLLGWSPLYSLRAGAYKVIDAPVPELYDLASDPGETQNLAGRDPGRAAGLQRRLREELQRAADNQRVALPASDPEAARVLGSLGYVSTSGKERGFALPSGRAATTDIALWRRAEEGFTLSIQGKHAEAAQAFERVLADDPDNLLALKFLGARALEVGDPRRAVLLSERVVASGLHTADALSNLVLAYDRLGRRDEALAAAGRALDADPDHLAARYNRATVLTAAGRMSEALQDLERVLTLDPKHPGAAALRTQLQSPAQSARLEAQRLAGGGNLSAAIKVLDGAVAANAQNVDLHDELGVLRMRAGDPAGARAAFERALALAPERLDVRERLAAALHRSGDRRRARSHFEEVAAAAPGRPEPRMSLAILDLEEGRPRQAAERLEPMTRGWPGAHQAWFFLGEARTALADRDGARRAYQTCVDQAPSGHPMAAEARRRLEQLR